MVGNQLVRKFHRVCVFFWVVFAFVMWLVCVLRAEFLERVCLVSALLFLLSLLRGAAVVDITPTNAKQLVRFTASCLELLRLPLLSSHCFLLKNVCDCPFSFSLFL